MQFSKSHEGFGRFYFAKMPQHEKNDDQYGDGADGDDDHKRIVGAGSARSSNRWERDLLIMMLDMRPYDTGAGLMFL